MKALTERNGWIFDTQSFSVHDGPGCRTTVFLMGCPLSCEWCANPEGMESRQQVMYKAVKCTNSSAVCTRCRDNCSQNAIKWRQAETSEVLGINRELCVNCREYSCVRACRRGALALCGKIISITELLRTLNRDRQFWGPEGGVTFSGGEPFFQPEFLVSALQKCQEAYIHTAVETSAYVSTELFLAGMRYVDFAFIDIKHMDTQAHEAKTGVPNNLILDNICKLAASGWSGRLVIRIPVIPGYNDSAENFSAAAEFIAAVGLTEVNLLPFHRLGLSKWTQLGQVYKYSEQELTQVEELEPFKQFFTDKNIKCYIASDTPF